MPFNPVGADPILLLEKGGCQLDVMLSLTDLECQARRGVPGDMAMHDPDTRVVGFEPNRDISFGREERDVTTWWVVVVEGTIGQMCRRVRTVLLSENDEVVAVQMHRMGEFEKGFGFHSFVNRRAVHRDDQIDPVIYLMVLGNQTILGRIERGVADIIDGRVREI